MEKRWIIVCLFIGILIVSGLFFGSLAYSKSLTGFNVFTNFITMPINIVNSGLVFLDIVFSVNLDSPRNITYNYVFVGDYLIDLNVSSNRNVSEWYYTLKSLNHGTIINNSVSFTPNSSIYAVTGSNELIVEAVDRGGNRKNESVIFYVNISNSAPEIINLLDNFYVCEDDYLSELFNVTDIDQDNLVGTLSLSNPFYVSPSYVEMINYSLWTYEVFSGMLNKADAGGVNAGSKKYQETISFSDGENIASQLFNITVIGINHAPILEYIGVQTVALIGDNNTFNHQLLLNDSEDGNQNSRNVSLNISFSPGAGLFNISSNGTMNYVGNESDLGIYNISICATDKGLRNASQNISLCFQDGSNLSTCISFNLTVTNENRHPTITSYYSTNLSIIVYEGETVQLNLTSYDPDRTTPDSYWYFDNAFSKQESGTNFSSLTYTFNYASYGNHSFMAKVSDGILNSSYVTWNVTVLDIAPFCGDVICNGVESCSDCSSDCGACGGVLGGGGGGGGGRCIEKWGCKEWDWCEDAEISYGLKKINLTMYNNILKNCSEKNIGKCGFQIRECKDVSSCGTNVSKPKNIRECFYTIEPNCTDEIQNCHDGSCEILTDCGGPCSACPTCTDGIKNQGEEDIDCGLPCPPCIEIALERTILNLIMIFFKKNIIYVSVLFFSIVLIWLVILLLRRRHRLNKEARARLYRKKAKRNV